MAEERSPVTTGSPVTGGQTTAAPDEVTTSLLGRNSLQLSNLSRSVTVLSNQMTVLSGSLQSISRGLATTQSLERQKEAQEQALENKLAQQQLREGKESLIEKKIEASAVAPAQKLAGQAQFTLGRLQNFFLTLIGGWLIDKGIDTINALSSGNKEELESIKNKTLVGLGAITGIFIASKLAIAKLVGAFGLVGIGLTGLAIAGLFTTPGQELIKFLTDSGVNALNGIKDWWDNSFGGGNNNDNDSTTLPLPPPPGATPSPSPQVGAGSTESPPPQVGAGSTESPPQPQPQPQQQNSTELPQQPIPGTKQELNKGGEVEGPPGIDNVPAKLTAGEFVMPVEAVETYGLDFMKAIQTMSLDSSDQMNKVGEAAVQAMNSGADTISAMGKADPDTISAMGKADPDYVNDRKNTDVDRSLDATLAREDMLLDIALDKEAQKAPEVSPAATIQSTQASSPQQIKISPISKDNTVSDVISQSTEQSAPIIVMQSSNESSASAPQEVPAASGGVGGVPSFPSKNSSDMYILTTLSLLNVVTD